MSELPPPPAAPAPGPRRPSPAARGGVDRIGLAGVVLVVLGLLLWALYRFTIAGEPHAFAPGSTPPGSVQLTAGQTYGISVRGGIDAVRGRDLDPQTIACELDSSAGGRQQLAIAPAADGTHALNQFATFVAPTTGRATVTCSGLPAVYVDDADDSGTDTAGVWLLLGTIALTVGVPLLLSYLRRVTRRPEVEPAA